MWHLPPPQLTAPRSSKKCLAPDLARRRETSATCRQRLAVCRLSSALDGDMLLLPATKHASSSTTRQAALRAAPILWLLRQAETGPPAVVNVLCSWRTGACDGLLPMSSTRVGCFLPACLRQMCWCNRTFSQCFSKEERLNSTCSTKQHRGWTACLCTAKLAVPLPTGHNVNHFLL